MMGSDAATEHLATPTLDSLLRFVKDGEVLTAARAELAALMAEAGRAATLAAENAALREALADCLPFLGGYQCDGMTEGDALTALERRIDALLADAEPGAAGARDETITALTKVAQIVVDCRDLPAGEFRDRWGVVTWADYYDKLTALADAALDALRDGGAGDKGAADGGAGGG
jgi:hypothetical protein